jgi:putative transcriptional regulator
MLSGNIRTIRKNKGFTQEELAVRLHVTRQTVSKWEKGLSVPDADLLSDMADILDVSVSELLGKKAEETREKDAVIEQLSRINGQMAVRNRRADRIIRTLAAAFILTAVFLAAFAIGRIKSDISRHPARDHIGKLTYTIPDAGYVHEKDDVGVTLEENGRERISAKIYKRYDDMSQIGIWEYGSEDRALMDEFREDCREDLTEFSGVCGKLPSCIEEICAATDLTEDEGAERSTYYKAFFAAGDRIYRLEVTGGDDPAAEGELFIASVDIDQRLEYEYFQQ